MILYPVILILLSIAALSAYASIFIGSGFYLKAECRLKTDEKLLALTFDDGPVCRTTVEICDILDRYGIKAAFFLIGSRIEGNEHILRQLSSSGHLVGNHSTGHIPTFPLFSADKMIADLKLCDDLILKSTGVKPAWFRPPFGITNPAVGKAAKSGKYRVMGWNIRSFDTIKKPDTVIRRIEKRLKPGAVILLHDDRPNTVRILPAIIESALKRGYRFVRPDEFL